MEESNRRASSEQALETKPTPSASAQQDPLVNAPTALIVLAG